MADPTPASLLAAMPPNVAATHDQLLEDGFTIEHVRPALSASGFITLRGDAVAVIEAADRVHRSTNPSTRRSSTKARHR